MGVASPLADHGPLVPLSPVVERRAAVWAASETLTHLPDAAPEYRRQVLRELLYALGLAVRPEHAEEVAS
jgi:hypothetical protein